MSMTTTQGILMIAIFSLTTFLTRVLPFVLFPAGKPTPRYVLYLGKVLPFAITAMLVVYCLKDMSLLAPPYGAPELIAVAVVAISFLAMKNTLLSIAAGTVVYMLLVQLVFV